MTPMMKRLFALLLAMTMVLALVACGEANTTPETTETPTQTTEDLLEDTLAPVETPEPNEATTVLSAIWTAVPEDNRFFAMGGDYENMVDNAPGAVTNADHLAGVLLVPAGTETLEAASLVHAMNLNSFTAGAFKVADAAAFAETMHEAIASNQWMCGFPDKMVIATIGNEYVVAAFGVNDAINPFEAKFVEAYPAATVVYSEAIA